MVSTSECWWEDLLRWFLVQAHLLKKCLLKDSYAESIWCSEMYPVLCEQMYSGNNYMRKWGRTKKSTYHPSSGEAVITSDSCVPVGLFQSEALGRMRCTEQPKPLPWNVTFQCFTDTGACLCEPGKISNSANVGKLFLSFSPFTCRTHAFVVRKRPLSTSVYLGLYLHPLLQSAYIFLPAFQF